MTVANEYQTAITITIFLQLETSNNRKLKIFLFTQYYLVTLKINILRP